MKKVFLLIAVLSTVISAALAQVQVQNLLIENLSNPVGLDVTSPRFSWQLNSPKRNVLQTAYEIRVASDVKAISKGNIWNSGKIMSDQSVLVPYNGAALSSGKKYYWQVRVWDNTGKASAWSTPASWQMGLLKPADWKASWIVPGFEEDSLRAAPLFRKEFSNNKKVSSAIAYITAHGMYEAKLNGKRVGDAYLTPGWTSYNKRLQYQAYDVTAQLQEGSNAIGVTVGNGWFRSDLAWGKEKRNRYGKEIALLFQLDITYTDGTTQSIISDESWRSSTGFTRYSEVYHG